MKQKHLNGRIIVTVLVIVTSVMLCSCDSLKYTEEQEDIIANYAAQIVLKHDEKYKYGYLSAIDDVDGSSENTDIKINIEQETESSGNSTDDNFSGNTGTDNHVADVNINQAFGIADGLDIEYTGYDVTSTYPSDGSDDTFVIKAVSDSNLLVVKFTLTNHTSEDMNVNFMENGKRYKGIVNESKKYNAQLTLLLDALNTFEGTISAGESRQLVLIFQTQLDSKGNLTSLSISVTDESGEEKVINLI